MSQARTHADARELVDRLEADHVDLDEVAARDLTTQAAEDEAQPVPGSGEPPD